jgi:hypothetical protein
VFRFMRVICDGLPLLRRQRQRGEHLEGHLRRISRRIGLPVLELAHDMRQRRRLVLSPDEITVERLAGLRRWTRVHHFHDVRQRWRLTHVCAEDRLIRAGLEPAAHEALWQRTEGLPTRHAGTEDLDEIPQHLGVVDHAIKDQLQALGIPGSQHGAKQRWHILHEALLAAVKRRAGDEIGRDLLTQLQHLLELVLRRGVVGAVQATRGRKLRQSLTRRESVSPASGFIEAVSLRSQGSGDGLEESFVSHVGFGWLIPCANLYC